MDKLTELERILYVYCKAREEQAGFSINKGNNEVTIENIKSFFDENPSGQVWFDGISNEFIQYEQSENISFEDIDWKHILAFPIETRNEMLNSMFFHCYDWGCYSLEVTNDNQLFVSLDWLNDNALYDYIEEDISDNILTVEIAREYIKENIGKYADDIFFDDLGKSKLWDLVHYFKYKPSDDPERFYFQKFRELTYQEAIEFTKQIQEDSLYTVSFCGNIKIPSKNQTEYLNEQAISVCDNLENAMSEDGKHPIKVVGMRYFIQYTESPHGFLNRSLIAGVDIEMTVQVKKDISKEDMESFLDLSKDCHYLVEDTDFDVGKVTIEQVGNKWEIVNDDMERE